MCTRITKPGSKIKKPKILRGEKPSSCFYLGLRFPVLKLGEALYGQDYQLSIALDCYPFQPEFSGNSESLDYRFHFGAVIISGAKVVDPSSQQIAIWILQDRTDWSFVILEGLVNVYLQLSFGWGFPLLWWFITSMLGAPGLLPFVTPPVSYVGTIFYWRDFIPVCLVSPLPNIVSLHPSLFEGSHKELLDFGLFLLSLMASHCSSLLLS